MTHGLWMRRETNDRSFGEAVYVRFNSFMAKDKSPVPQNNAEIQNQVPRGDANNPSGEN